MFLKTVSPIRELDTDTGSTGIEKLGRGQQFNYPFSIFSLSSVSLNFHID